MRLLVLLWALAVAPDARALSLTIYHTNDIHGWIMPHSRGRQKGVGGGAAAFAALLRQDPAPKLVLDAGDWFQGTPEGTLSKGQALVEVMNAVGYDVVAVGNHDFDFGEARLQELVPQLKADVLGANVYRGRKRVAYLKPWVVKEVGGVKVGVFGLLTTKMRALSFAENIKGLQFKAELAQAREAVRELKKLGATVIVAVTHVGYESAEQDPYVGDQTIAREVGGIDVIVGGHTHTAIHDPERDSDHGTLIAQAGTGLLYAGKIELELDPETRKVISSRGRLIELSTVIGEDVAVATVVKRLQDQVGPAYDAVLATATVELARNREGESALGDWIADCERAWAGSDVAVHNAGGIRSDLPEGPVTLRSIFNISPFENHMVTATMDGEALLDLLDHGAGKSKGMIQVSGVTFRYRREGAPGERVDEVAIAGKRLDPRGTYRVASIDFLAQGGDGYTAFSRAQKVEKTAALLRDVLKDCAVNQGLIAAPVGGRMTAGR